jgi:hypothetical protein
MSNYANLTRVRLRRVWLVPWYVANIPGASLERTYASPVLAVVARVFELRGRPRARPVVAAVLRFPRNSSTFFLRLDFAQRRLRVRTMSTGG